jgi:hypothetical protein
MISISRPCARFGLRVLVLAQQLRSELQRLRLLLQLLLKKTSETKPVACIKSDLPKRPTLAYLLLQVVLQGAVSKWALLPAP